LEYNGLLKFVQEHFTDGLALVVGSGLSAAEGIPGMAALAIHLSDHASKLVGDDASCWTRVKRHLDDGAGLEAALLAHPPTVTVEEWIVRETCNLLVPRERLVIGAVLRGEKSLQLTAFLRQILKPSNGLPILTTNYDRLVELACELAGYHVDCCTVGHYAGVFDHARSSMASCRGIVTRGKTPILDHFPRAVVLKPHGSLDWYRFNNDVRRCAMDVEAERLIITPGLNKYRAGYESPFDKQRELANEHINRSSRLLVVGYGFNDDHLQTHLVRKIASGAPTLVLARTASEKVTRLARESPRCVLIAECAGGPGIAVTTSTGAFSHSGPALWDLGTLTQELLS